MRLYDSSLEKFLTGTTRVIPMGTSSNITVEKYRQILNDYKTPSNLIGCRLKYLEALSRNIIHIELTNYISSKPTQKQIKQPKVC
jgi:hypothetical protein